MNTIYTGPGLSCPDPTDGFSDRIADEREAMRCQMIEDKADELLADCLQFDGAQLTFQHYDMAETDLPANLMKEIANWNWRSDTATETMKRLHILLSNELKSVARAIDAGIY